MDQLAYTYQGNRLQAVDDQVSSNQLPRPSGYHGAPASRAGHFQEQGVKLGQEYLYDLNGNLIQDQNKGITGILYNHLNLPRQIRFGQGADSVVFRLKQVYPELDENNFSNNIRRIKPSEFLASAYLDATPVRKVLTDPIAAVLKEIALELKEEKTTGS